MGAIIGKLGMGLLGAGGLLPRPGADAAVITVRAGRIVYIGSAAYIAGCWYFGWRNQRVDPGSYEFPIPGLYKGEVKHEGGAVDAEDASDIALWDATPGSNVGTPPTQNPPLDNLKPAPGGLTGTPALLERLGRLAPSFGIQATEHPKFGGVKSGAHNPDGFHPKGRAIDFVGPLEKLATFAKYVDENFRPQIAEMIWAGPQPKSVKNGASVPSTFWGAKTWAGHRTHVHLAM